MTFLVYILLISFLSFTTAEYSVDHCWALGLNKANLLCSSCKQLNEFHLSIMNAHCLECCTQDEDTSSGKKYAKAVLEVCTCKFGAYPQIQAFVKSDRPEQFPNLKIHYVRGLDPIIKLMDENEQVQETLAIDKWNTDSVEEFLRTHLEEVDNRDYLKTNRI